jgi:Flp pilus assembly protein TadD
LSLLADDRIEAIKTREIGESMSHIVLKDVIGGDGQAAALLSYQIISITAGLLCVVAVALFALKLYERTAERVLFLLGVCTGGYMLLSFGYVENYSLFVLSVLTYTLTGLLIAQGKASRYWILPPVIAAVFLHALGVTLIPSALYLWVGPSRFGRSIRAWRPLTRLVAAIPIAVVIAIVFHHFYTTSYFFQFALTPPLENRFTIEGYTIFSINHLADFVNLAFLLVPGLLIMIVVLSGRSARRSLTQRPFIYLAVLISSVLGAAFIFDPKLGMPRDWDLFSFAGVPLVVLCYYLLLKLRPYREYTGGVAVLSIALGCLILIPRAVSQVLPDIAVVRFKYHATLDSSRNMNARTVLQEYLRQQGDSLALKQDVQKFRADYPEWTINEDGLSLGEAGRYDQAIPLFQRAIQLNPGFWSAYANLGWCYLRTNQVDSAVAYLEWANGLSLGGSRVNYRLGTAYLVAGDLDRAEFRLLEALKLDSAEHEAMAGLVQLCRMTGRKEEMFHYLTRLTQMENAALQYTAWLGDYYLENGRYEEAAATYRRAIDRGLDSTFIDNLLDQYPRLKAAWR